MGSVCSRTRAEALDELRRLETSPDNGADRLKLFFLHRAVEFDDCSKNADCSENARRAEREYLLISASGCPKWGEGWAVSFGQWDRDRDEAESPRAEGAPRERHDPAARIPSPV